MQGLESGQAFDFIVVGSGSAGAALASRLSEDGKFSVALLEAGAADRSLWHRWPIGYVKIIGNPALMWNYESVPEPNLNGRRISAIRGKVVGGSSSVNGMIYVRGCLHDYNTWRQLGAIGWGYDDVLPFFRKAERYELGSDPYHGDAGPIGVERVRWRYPLADAFIDAGREIGLPHSDDFCGRDFEGVGYYQTTTWKGRRSSTARYLDAARARPNFTLITGAQARRIIWNGRHADGIEIERDGTRLQLRARREVILSSGSLATPQLLQLSGVGPGALLQRYGIPLVHDLPGVGENLIDHPSVKRSYTTSSKDTINVIMSSLPGKMRAGLRYLTRRSGPLAAAVASAGGFVRSRPELDLADLQLFMIPFDAGDYWNKLAVTSCYQMVAYRLRPDSRGHVRITSPDPNDPPEIFCNYFDDPSDMRTTIDGLRLLKRIAEASPLQAVKSSQLQPKSPDESDEALTAYVRETATTTWHHVGTCKMGTDPLAVVGPDLRVHGISGLRVADGSIMPTLVSGNTNAACIMIGEKCADMIRTAA